MADRYTIIFQLGEMLYSRSSPVMISAGTLRMNSLSRSFFAHLTLTNSGTRVIESVSVLIHPLDPSGKELRTPVEYTYENVNCEQGESFGEKTAIVIPNPNVRSFDVQIRSVTFEDGEVWDGDGAAFEKLAPLKTLEEALEDEELAHQFRIRYGNDCVYMPHEEDDLWFCTCGAVNEISEAKCHHCHRVYNALKSVNIASLRAECKQRLESEKKLEEEENEELSEKRGKLKKLLLILVPSILIVIVALALIIGSTTRKNAYAHAVGLLNDGMFDEAATAFAQLGDYKDCAELSIHEVPYQKALYVMRCAENDDTDALVMLDMKRSELPEDETVGTSLYRKAAEMFKALGDYKDSAELAKESEKRIVDIRLAALEERYLAAAALLEENSYCEARDAFMALGDYKDSGSMANESIYKMASALSELSENYRLEGVYCKLSDVTGEKNVFYIPQDVFKSIGGGIASDIRALFSSNSVEINFEAAPENPDYLPFDEALRALYASLGDYKDSAEKTGISVEAEGTVEEKPEETSEETTVSDTEFFFNYCASGDLISAYQWLSDHKNEFESGNMWLNILGLYIPYCGTWSFDQGDPVLLSSTINVDMPCNSFTSVVKVAKDGSAILCIYPEGNPDYLIQLNSEIADDGSIRFSVSPDGIILYYAVIDKSGQFNYSKYNIFALKQKNDSCAYVKQ